METRTAGAHHTEILCDLDLPAAAAAQAAGATPRRTEPLHAHPAFIAMLENVVRQRL